MSYPQVDEFLLSAAPAFRIEPLSVFPFGIADEFCDEVCNNSGSCIFASAMISRYLYSLDFILFYFLSINHTQYPTAPHTQT